MGMMIDGIAGNGAVDSSGEILNVEGADITELLEGKGMLNWEHSAKADDMVGKIVYAKKIMEPSDCTTERQKMYFEKSRGPFIYIVGELFDEEENPGAIAIASMVRYAKNKKESLLVGYSVEGSTLERDDNILNRSVIRRVSITLRPCNKASIAGFVEDPSSVKKAEPMLFEVDSPIYSGESTLYKEIKDDLEALHKTLTASGSNVAPSNLSGGAALSIENFAGKNRLKAAVRDWNRVRPLKEVIKAALPELSDQYVDYFSHLTENMMIKKNQAASLLRTGASHAVRVPNESQKAIIEGLHWDKEHSPKTKLLSDAGIKVYAHPKKGRESEVYGLVHDFFGCPELYQCACDINHPHFGTMTISEFKRGIDNLSAPDQFKSILDEAHWEPDMDKIRLIDSILGISGKRSHNLIFVDGKPLAINNGINPNGDYEKLKELVHPEANAWLQSLDHKKFAKKLLDEGLDSGIIESMVYRLINAKRSAMGQEIVKKSVGSSSGCE